VGPLCDRPPTPNPSHGVKVPHAAGTSQVLAANVAVGPDFAAATAVPPAGYFTAFEASPVTSVRWSDEGVPPQQQVFFSVLLIVISGFKYTLWGYIGSGKAIVKEAAENPRAETPPIFHRDGTVRPVRRTARSTKIVWRLKGRLGGLQCAYQGDDHDDPDTQDLLGIYVAAQPGEGG
jgi:hypothetical protein